MYFISSYFPELSMQGEYFLFNPVFFYYITDIDMLESKCQVFDSGMDKKVDKEGVGLGAEAGVGEGGEDGLGEVLYAAAAPSRIVMHFPSELQ